MPVALIEAQLAGIPVVAVDAGSVSEVIDDGTTGFVFEEFGEDYIKKVREFVTSSETLKSPGKAPRERALKEISVEKLVNSHLTLFNEILGR